MEQALPILVSANKRKTPAEIAGVAKRMTEGGRLFVAVVADRLDGATLEGLHALRDFLFGRRLLVHVGITTFIMAREERGRRLTAEIAVDALLIDVEFTRSVLGPFISLIRHRWSEGQRVQLAGVSSGLSRSVGEARESPSGRVVAGVPAV
jgi:hypothetical protein